MAQNLVGMYKNLNTQSALKASFTPPISKQEGSNIKVTVEDEDQDLSMTPYHHNGEDGSKGVNHDTDTVIDYQPNTNANYKVWPEVKGCVLIMIVKNESKIITRCLDSMQKGEGEIKIRAVNGICITDTGSTDNCVEVIEKWAKDNDMPCSVPIHAYKPGEFKFSDARTLSFLNGRKYFPNAKYYLTVDADMILQIKDGWDVNKLTLGSYSLYQQSTSTRYQNTRLLRADGIFTCLGGTHEFWRGQRIDPNSKKLVNLAAGVCHELEILDLNDGGCKADKFTRDRQILEDELKDPETPHEIRIRDTFYLGQTYDCLGMHKESIDMYLKRYQMGGWDQERWYSLLQVARCYKKLGDYENTVKYYTQAHDFRPSRAEAMCELATYYRNRGNNRLAFMCAEVAREVGYPQHDSLFIKSAVYDWEIDFEMSIAGFYLKDKKPQAAQAHRRLMALMEKLPAHIRPTVKNNGVHYKF